MTVIPRKSAFEQLTRREYALIACGLGALVLAFLPVLLHRFGTRWRPGVPRSETAKARRVRSRPEAGMAPRGPRMSAGQKMKEFVSTPGPNRVSCKTMSAMRRG